MQAQKIEDLLEMLDGSGSSEEFEAVWSLQTFEYFPTLLLQKYRTSKRWAQRASCVYHALKYGRENSDAFELGVLALKDKSKVVRYRAAMLLAVAQNPRAIAPLQEMANLGGESASDAVAAMAAIRAGNHNLFVDRDGSGMMTLRVN